MIEAVPIIHSFIPRANDGGLVCFMVHTVWFIRLLGGSGSHNMVCSIAWFGKFIESVNRSGLGDFDGTICFGNINQTIDW